MSAKCGKVCKCTVPCNETERWHKASLAALKYRAKVNARKLPCPGMTKAGKACAYKYDPVKSYACARHMKVLSPPDGYVRPEPREPRLSTTPRRFLPSQYHVPREYIAFRAPRSGIVCHLYEEEISSCSTDVLIVWRDKVIPALIEKLPVCHKSIAATFTYSYYSKLIDATIASRTS